jgi:hypothetical protein
MAIAVGVGENLVDMDIATYISPPITKIAAAQNAKRESLMRPSSKRGVPKAFRRRALGVR